MTILESYVQSNLLVETEHQRLPLEVEGRIPKAIKGRLFRNGNGRFEHKGVRYKHLFDGDGMISAFYFESGGVYYSNRHIRTRELEEEDRKNKMLYRSFGTNLPGGWKKNVLKMQFKNAANTSVIWHAGKLLALWEGGLPHEIDPDTLETLGRFDFDGTLLNPYSFIDRQISPELPFSAHPKFDQTEGALYNFGTLAGIKQRLMIYKVDSEGKASIEHAIPMAGVVFTHDFILTAQKRMLFFFTPVKFQLWQAFLGLKPPVESLKGQPGAPAEIVLVDGSEKKIFQTEAGFIFHYANGFEREDGTLVVDAWTMDSFPEIDIDEGEGSAPSGTLMRYEIKAEEGKVKRQPISDFRGELPYINQSRKGRPYRYVWSIGDPSDSQRALLHSLLKTDVETGKVMRRDYFPHLPGEPVFIPNPEGAEEDDGWIAFLLFDSNHRKTQLHLLDASRLETEAVVTLPHNIPLGFHGTWVGEKG